MPSNNLSFIPKKKLNSPVYRKRGLGVFNTVSFVLFLISGLVCGGFFLYKNDLTNKVEAQKQNLDKSERGFEISLISKLIEVSGRIDATKEIIEGHTTVRPVFDFLEDNTLKEVSYDSFAYSVSESGSPEVTLGGSARGYGVLALQVKTFEDHKDVEKVAFSNITVADKGKVNFSAKLVLKPSLIEFKGK